MQLTNNGLVTWPQKGAEITLPRGLGWLAATLRKEKLQPYLDNEFLAGLNYYFGDLCNDENYVKPVPLEINPETHPPLELQDQEFDVMMALSKVKETATGPDGLPF